MFPTRNGAWQQVNRSTTSNAVGGRFARTPASTGSRPYLPQAVATLISGRVDVDTASQQLGHSSAAIAIAADVAHILDELAGADREAWPNTSGIRCGIAPSGSNEEPAPNLVADTRADLRKPRRRGNHLVLELDLESGLLTE